MIPANTMNDGNWRLSEDLTILFSHVRPYHFVVRTHYVTGGSDLDWSVYRDNIPTEAGKRYKLFYRALALVQNIFTLPPTQIEANVIVSLMKGTQVVHIEEIPADQSDELQEIQFTGDGSLYYLKITIEPPPDLAEMRAVFATSDFKMVELVRDTVEINFAGPNEYLYQGKKELEGTDFYDFHARNYHAALGRFMSVDPIYNGPSGYVGMLNNPVATIDPDGKDPTGGILTAVAIAAAIRGVSYTASIALSDGGFNNWDWGQFGQQVAIGAASAPITFGIGTAFEAAYGLDLTFGQQVLKSAVHAHIQGGIEHITGGDYLTGAPSGFVGGVVGGQAARLGNGAAIGASMLLGGITAEATGGEFWRGGAVAGIVAGANDVAHRMTLSPAERAAREKQREIRKLQRQMNKAQKGGNDPLKLLADILHHTPSFGVNSPNPFQGAVAIYADGGWSFVGAEGDAGGFFILVGRDKGRFVSFTELAGGAASDAGIGFEIGRVDVTGNPNDFNSSYLFGLRDKVWGSISPTGEIISIGGAYSWGMSNGESVTTRSLQFGLGASPLPFILGGGYNHGRIKE